MAFRSRALDVFRGGTIAAMTLVNNPGSWSAGHQYAPLTHAEWHGWTPTDLVFPFFVFIVGVAMAFSLAPRDGASGSAGVGAKIARRAIVIFALGLWLSFFLKWDFTTIRIPGVLQRIALCYLCAAPFALRASSRVVALSAAGLLVAHTLLLTLVPVPGFGEASLEPERNLGAWIDRLVFHRHLYKGTWDPEGLLGTLTGTATALTGLLAGRWIRSGATLERKMGALFVTGVIGFAAGLAADRVIPINKPLWTGSYVLVTSGLAATALAFTIALCDWRPLPSWMTEPFVAFGRNAILLFVLEGMIGRLLGTLKVSGASGPVTIKSWIYGHWFTPFAIPINASLLYALANVVLFGVVAVTLHRRRLYLKV